MRIRVSFADWSTNMIPDQKPLLNNPKRPNIPNSEEIIGGPEFQAAPGWGHKVNEWLKKYFGRVVLPAAAIVILVIGINNYMESRSDREAFKLDELGATGIVKLEEETGEIVELEEVVTDKKGNAIELIQIAEPGDGITHLARKALKNYMELNDDIRLIPEQKIYAEDFLKDLVGSQPLEIGDTIKFSARDIQNAIDAANLLSDTQIQNLSKYVPLVVF